MAAGAGSAPAERQAAGPPGPGPVTAAAGRAALPDPAAGGARVRRPRRAACGSSATRHVQRRRGALTLGKSRRPRAGGKSQERVPLSRGGTPSSAPSELPGAPGASQGHLLFYERFPPELVTRQLRCAEISGEGCGVDPETGARGRFPPSLSFLHALS